MNAHCCNIRQVLEARDGLGQRRLEPQQCQPRQRAPLAQVHEHVPQQTSDVDKPKETRKKELDDIKAKLMGGKK